MSVNKVKKHVYDMCIVTLSYELTNLEGLQYRENIKLD